MSANSFRDDPNTSRSSDEQSRNTQEREDLSNALERTEKLGKGRSRSRSPIAPSASSMEEAARRLEEARREIREAAEKRRADREAQIQDTGPRYVYTEGRFFLDEYGYVERGPRGQKLFVEKPRTAGTVSFTSPNTSVDGASHLRENKRFGPYVVPQGKETPLREVITKHQSANEIRRPQSKIPTVESPPKDADENEKEWDYSDLDDNEIF
ncbi:hypothetical protein V8E51_014309 [Hyaloscypha variabilis]